MARLHLQSALRALERSGLLLLQDPQLPSLVTLIAKQPIKGSWWGHPRGQAIFKTYNDLVDQPLVITTKLVSGKVTFVHQRLWPALIVIGRAREPWQMSGLSAAAKRLLGRTEAGQRVRGSGKPAKQLERRLLVFSEQVHTESGAHAIELMSWSSFAKHHKIPMRRRSVSRARHELDAIIATLNADYRARATLPWMSLGIDP